MTVRVGVTVEVEVMTVTEVNKLVVGTNKVAAWVSVTVVVAVEKTVLVNVCVRVRLAELVSVCVIVCVIEGVGMERQLQA